MSLENKSLAELEELASNLRSQIALNPNHTAMEKVELEDVQGWLKLRDEKRSARRRTTLRSRERHKGFHRFLLS